MQGCKTIKTGYRIDSRPRFPPRLRPVLDCLLEDDGEKQVAARLGLTRQTVNQYVKAVYRHFRVNSRPELMARWIRFARGHPVPAAPQHLQHPPQLNAPPTG